jgi:hypothetical protein
MHANRVLRAISILKKPVLFPLFTGKHLNTPIQSSKNYNNPIGYSICLVFTPYLNTREHLKHPDLYQAVRVMVTISEPALLWYLESISLAKRYKSASWVAV